jgi:hypothetical protein
VAAIRAAQGRGTEDREHAEDREDTQDRKDTMDREDAQDSEDTVAREGTVDQFETYMECSEEEVAAGYLYQDDIVVLNIE